MMVGVVMVNGGADTLLFEFYILQITFVSFLMRSHHIYKYRVSEEPFIRMKQYTHLIIHYSESIEVILKQQQGFENDMRS